MKLFPTRQRALFPMGQLISYAEMLTSATTICSTLRDIPCIGDGDTGYGNSVNVKRTVKGYAQVRRREQCDPSVRTFLCFLRSGLKVTSDTLSCSQWYARVVYSICGKVLYER